MLKLSFGKFDLYWTAQQNVLLSRAKIFLDHISPHPGSMISFLNQSKDRKCELIPGLDDQYVFSTKMGSYDTLFAE